jgi:hypothetical protein
MICSVAECQKPADCRGLCQAHYRRLRRHGDPLAGITFNGEPRQFFEQALTHRSDECLIWPYGKVSNGYSQIRINGKQQKVSRLVCQHIHGDPPSPRHEAAHSCNVRACVNPQHLRWATSKQNKADQITHGTARRGERNGRSKLTANEVVEIRSSADTGRSLARRFGVSETAVSRARFGKAWAHMP